MCFETISNYVRALCLQDKHNSNLVSWVLQSWTGFLVEVCNDHGHKTMIVFVRSIFVRSSAPQYCLFNTDTKLLVLKWCIS